MRWRGAFLVIRLTSVVLLAALLTVHVRSLRVFRWEQWVSGGLIVAYGISMLGLVLESGLDADVTNARFFQAYICATGTILLSINAGVIYQRWRKADELTRVVAELLGAIGVPLQRQVITKVYLSAATAACLFFDFALSMIMMADDKHIKVY